MKSYLKCVLFVVFSVCLSTQIVYADLEQDLQRCSQECSFYCADVIQKTKSLTDSAESKCQTNDDINITCIPHCLRRGSYGYSDYGQCISSGADFCGKNPKCIPNCLRRGSYGYADYGECIKYGEDICSVDN